MSVCFKAQCSRSTVQVYSMLWSGTWHVCVCVDVGVTLTGRPWDRPSIGSSYCPPSSLVQPVCCRHPPSLIITVIRELCIPGGGLALEDRFCVAWQSSSWPSQGLVGPGRAHWVASPSSFGSHGALHIAKEWSAAQIGSLASLASQKGKSRAPSLPRSSWTCYFLPAPLGFREFMSGVCSCIFSPHYCLILVMLRFKHFYLIVEYAIHRGDKCVHFKEHTAYSQLGNRVLPRT